MSSELLIMGGTVVTMGPSREIHSPGGVLVSGSRILAAGPAGKLVEQYPDAPRFHAENKLILPGFINAHTHGSHILLRGGPSQDKAHLDWLLNVLYPAVDLYDVEAVRTAYLLFCLEAISSGTTTVVDNIIWGDRADLTTETINLYRQVGLRTIYARMFSNISLENIPYVGVLQNKEPSVHKVLFPREGTEAALQRIEDLMMKYNNPNDRLIQVWPAPGIPSLITHEGLSGSLALARKFDTMVTTHLAETVATSQWNGISITEYLDDIGFLDPRLSAAHCVWMNDKDLRLLKRNDVKVVNNVVSNMFLGSGIAPVARMHDLGLCVGLGTDDVNCNNSANMLLDMKFAALAQKAKYLDAAALTAEKALEMATIDGARAIGMEKEIGSLEAGKMADLVILDMNQPHLVPCHHIPSTLVYQARGTEVVSVMVDGNWLMLDRVPQFLKGPGEIQKLMEKVQKASLKVIKQAGMDHLANRKWVIE